ncbi:MAG TPA: PAS domain-containing protein, partial [Thermoanaerobaculia bacterium]|nr:PAS domain-containing protein [Thermoanaerobaculia bacterium]
MIDRTGSSGSFGSPSGDAAVFSLGEALAGIDDHVAVYDREWRYVYLNQRGAEVLGRTREELLGRCIWEVFPDAVGNQYWRELHQAVAEGKPIHSEHHYLTWDRWYENHIYPFPGGVCVLSSDITERKRAQLEKESLLVRLEAVARQMPAAVMIADAASGTLVFCNERVFEILGYDDRLERRIDPFDDPPQIEGFRPDGGRLTGQDWPIARVLRTGEVVRGEEIEIRRLDGTRVTIEVNAGPVRDEEGGITAGVVVFLDVTDRKRAEEALRDGDRRKDEFLAMLAHELRNPMAPIRNAVEILKMIGSSEPLIDRCRDVIERQVIHLARLVDDL